MKQKEFSKRIFNVIVSIYIVVTIFAMALMWKTDNSDALSYLIPSITGLMATTIGFYYWKAKAENIMHISKEIGIEKYKETKDMIDEISDDNSNSSEY